MLFVQASLQKQNVGRVQYQLWQWHQVAAPKKVLPPAWTRAGTSSTVHGRQIAPGHTMQITRRAYSNKEAKLPWTISSQSVMAENFLWMPRECNTIWGIWPLKLCNISRSLWRWPQPDHTVVSRRTSGPWCPTKVVLSSWRQELLAAYTVNFGAQHSHTGATFPRPLWGRLTDRTRALGQLLMSQ